MLWLLMFLVGAHFSIPDYMERGTEEFICANLNMPECKVGQEILSPQEMC